MSVGPEDPNATEHDIDLLKDSSRVGHLPSFLERLDDRVSAFVGYVFLECVCGRAEKWWTVYGWVLAVRPYAGCGDH
eukprot:29709-Eustigmatos_ZCMA.PRE.1